VTPKVFSKPLDKAHQQFQHSLDDMRVLRYIQSIDGYYKKFWCDFERSLISRYDEYSRIKCPFIRRRFQDVLDSVAIIADKVSPSYHHFVIPGCSSRRKNEIKSLDLSVVEIANIIQSDWHGKFNNSKGYYITGDLSTSIYRDDCLFDSVDPDFPILGLKKYLSSSSQLFDRKVSKAELQAIEINTITKTITVDWRLEGKINLPWHPTFKPFTGRTTYYLDEQNLIYKHSEVWNIGVLKAFLSTINLENIIRSRDEMS
jgi:hypothetical protein